MLIAVKSKQVLSALRTLIEQSGFEDTVKEAMFFKDFLAKIRIGQIDLILLDWYFFDDDTIDMISFVRRINPKTNFIILGMQKKNKKDISSADVDTFFLKCDPPGELLRMIDSFREDIGPRLN